MITGGTGTFGKAFIDLCLENTRFHKIIILSRDEFKQHSLKNSLVQRLGSAYVEDRFRFFLGDVRDRERLQQAFRGVDVIIHAAALKHVPFCEYNPSEALLTNVTGTKNVCDIALECNVKRVVCLSTDKAVEPINFYGSTKMLAEKYAIYSNIYAVDRSVISCVRYGNIVGSRGSIVETFRNQPKDRPFEITDYAMTRFWMHIRQAAEMVLWTIDNARGGEIVIPKIKASKLVDLATIIDPTRKQKLVGIRPGEKLHEQLINRRENELMYEHPRHAYYVVIPESTEFGRLREYYDDTNQNESCSDWYRTNRESYYSNDKDIQMTTDEILVVSRA